MGRAPESMQAPAVWRSAELAELPGGGAERQARLLTFSLPAMESLYLQLDNAQLTILLSDTDGRILAMVGAEVAAGATAHPTEALASKAEGSISARLTTPLQARKGSGLAPIHVDATATQPGLLGIATPILSPDARALGVLGALGIIGFFGQPAPRLESLSHPNALLQTTAEIIEHRLIENDERGFLVLRFHPRRGVLGSPLEALAVFDHDSRLLAANRVARRLLALGEGTSDTRCMNLFEAHWRGIVGYAALCIAEPFVLRARGGLALFARALLR